MRRPTVLTPDNNSPALRATPVERMQAEINQLRSTVKHLGSEVITLRAQMTKLRSVLVPPDVKREHADDSDEYARPESGPHDLDRPAGRARVRVNRRHTCRPRRQWNRQSAHGGRDSSRYQHLSSRPCTGHRPGNLGTLKKPRAHRRLTCLRQHQRPTRLAA